MGFRLRSNAVVIKWFYELLGEGGLAKLASRILSVEAEHRTLGGDVAGKRVPNNLCLERRRSPACPRRPRLCPILFEGP